MDSWVAINNYSWMLYQERCRAAEKAYEMVNLGLGQGMLSEWIESLAAWLRSRKSQAPRAAPQQLQTA